jgi:hypothetical protein
MRHLPTFALAALLACLLAAPANAAFFLGDPLAGPGPEVRELGDLDLARDGSGALAWVNSIDGVDHILVSRFERGAFQPVERVDAALPGPSSQPVVGASDNGRLAIVFVNDGTVYGVVRPAAGLPYSAPVAFGPGSDPSVDLSINGTAFASFTSLADVRIVRLDRRTNAWAGLPQPADVDPARAAGVGSGRSRVAISADGIGVVTWGEAGHVFARKMFQAGVSNAPQDLTPPDFGGRVATTSDLPSVDAEDDSSYAWIVFRQSFADGGSRTLARRQRGTAFDPPVAVDTGDESVRDPRIDLSGRGQGLATSTGASSGQPLAAIIDKRDAFQPGFRILAPSAVPSVAAAAISENNLSVVAAILAGAGAPPTVAVQPFDDGKPDPAAVLSRPELGPVDPDGGFDAASDRSGGAVVAWVQGAPAERRIVTGYFDRPPSRFLGYTGQGCCRGVTPTLKWQEAFNIWGPTRYEVIVDGAVVGQTENKTELALPVALKAGTHAWQVRATDIRGQSTRSKTRVLRVDGRKPLLSVRYRRKKRVVVLVVRGRDDASRGRLASGLEGVRVSWGDGTRPATGRFEIRATHRYPRGRFTLRITGRDKAGNEVVDERRLRIGV